MLVHYYGDYINHCDLKTCYKVCDFVTCVIVSEWMGVNNAS